VRSVASNSVASYDPRSPKATLMVGVLPAHLARFTPGPAVFRATAVGRDQWMRTPPPTIGERVVQIGGLSR
jgi:hypothetical protein